MADAELPPSCSCIEPGVCSRRNCIISGVHFRKCQAGQVVMLDELYANKIAPVLPERSVVALSGDRTHMHTMAVKPEKHQEKVGTALKARIEKLITVKSVGGCGCGNLAAQMDGWGIAGCERRREEIVRHLVENKQMLVDALFEAGGWCNNAASLGMALIPAASLVPGANWLLTQAIEDVRITAKPRKLHSPNQGKHEAIPPMVRTPLAAIVPRPFTAEPRLTIICHCWPNGDNWRRHVAYLEPMQNAFARKILGVATGPGTATFAEVQAAFGDSWEYFEVANDKKLREVLTYRRLMEMINTTDENDVTFCVHLKGAQDHTAGSEQIKWWTEAMYATVVYNWRNILQKMAEGYPIAGSFMRHGKHLKTRYEWHYSGTFYAFRNAAAFASGIPQFDKHWYGTESWPGHHFAKHEAACMFGDGCGDLYKKNEKLERSLIEWKQRHDTL